MLDVTFGLRCNLQTGDKWRHVPDMRSVLLDPNNHAAYGALIAAAALTVLGLCVVASRRDEGYNDQLYLLAAWVAVASTLAYRLDDADLVNTRYACSKSTASCIHPFRAIELNRSNVPNVYSVG